MPVYALHHTEVYYPNPYSFDPSRWIADANTGVSETDVSRANSAYVTFNVGPTSCIGRPLAEKEICVTVTRVLFTYDMRQEPGSTLGEGDLENPEPLRRRTDRFQALDIFPSIIDGPVVNFRARSF